MRPVLAEPVWGLLPLPDGFAYIKYERYPEGRLIASFWQFSIPESQKSQITQEQYLKYKLGESFRQILEHIGHSKSLLCQASSDRRGRLLALCPETGRFNLFDSESGRLLRQGTLLYKDTPIISPVFAGESWWGICPGKNSVLNLKEDWSWNFYAGGEGNPSFPEPVHLSAYPGRDGNTRLYVCCKGSESIRSLNPDIQRLGIYDFCPLPGHQPLRYFRAAKKHLVLLANGVWAL